MKTYHGRDGHTVMRRWSMGVLGLAFVLGVLVLPGEASGNTHGDGFTPIPPSGAGPGGGSEPPPKPPAQPQECFEQFLSNQLRCHKIWCDPASLIWITWTSCQDRFLNKCVEAAGLVFACCLQGGPPCGGD